MKAISFAIILALGLFASRAAEAQRPRPHGFGGERFEANKKFGLGLELGEPTGVTGKLFLTPDNALDFGIGDLYRNYYIAGSGIHLYMDYLWHPFVLTKAEAFYLPFYVGVGGRFWNTDYCDRGNVNCASLFGVRVPIGISFDFNNVPLDIFLQLVPTLDFYRNYYPGNRSVYLDIDFSFGVRFWFS